MFAIYVARQNDERVRYVLKFKATCMPEPEDALEAKGAPAVRYKEGYENELARLYSEETRLPTDRSRSRTVRVQAP